jgi:hypothetical protein
LTENLIAKKLVVTFSCLICNFESSDESLLHFHIEELHQNYSKRQSPSNSVPISTVDLADSIEVDDKLENLTTEECENKQKNAKGGLQKTRLNLFYYIKMV